jgi:hypothetical protein
MTLDHAFVKLLEGVLIVNKSVVIAGTKVSGGSINLYKLLFRVAGSGAVVAAMSKCGRDADCLFQRLADAIKEAEKKANKRTD